MVDASALGNILSPRNALWLMALVNALVAFRVWTLIPSVMERWNERKRDADAARANERRDTAAEKAADWQRLRDEVGHYAERLHAVELRHGECERNLIEERQQRHADVSALRDELATERAARVKLQAIIDGFGEIRQAAASAAAEIRADAAEQDKTARRKKDKPDA